MSASGPYKSRLFNFLNQQYISFVDTCDRAVRQVKVASVWGVQILLYPVYVLVQASRFAGHQLQQALQNVLPQLQSADAPQQQTPPVDLPIQQVLEDVDTLPVVESLEAGIKINQQIAIAEPAAVISVAEYGSVATIGENKITELGTITLVNPEAQKITNITGEGSDSKIAIAPLTSVKRNVIQGVASLLKARTLVLITSENQILDILTPQQQQKLQHRISWELAAYWRKRRMLQTSAKGFINRLQPPTDQSRLLPPVRLFWDIISWVQTGQVAIAANLFQESALLANGNWESQNLEIESQKYQQFFILDRLTFLDETVADLEINPIIPPLELPSAIAHSTQSFIQLIRNQFQQPGLQTASAHTLESRDSWHIQALIQAAIEYFFGSDRKTVISSRVQNQPNQFSNSQPLGELAAAGEIDPWLTENDLFGETSTPKVSRRKTQKVVSSPQITGEARTNLALPSQTETIADNVTNHQRHLNPKQSVNKPSSKRSKSQRSQKVGKNQPQSDRQPKAKNQFFTSGTNVNLDYTSEWLDIETEATPMGYVKHPLEQLLELLDRAILWLEEKVVKIWRWITKLI